MLIYFIDLKVNNCLVYNGIDVLCTKVTTVLKQYVYKIIPAKTEKYLRHLYFAGSFT